MKKSTKTTAVVKPQKKQPNIDLSTENKIKEAARKLFTAKGYSAVTTRDIAEEANINVALLNYYFRSKEKLFQLIMEESIQQFMMGIAHLFGQNETDLHVKITRLTEGYIDMLLQFPDLPTFILAEMSRNPMQFTEKMHGRIEPTRQEFIQQIEEKMKKGEFQKMHIVHFFANLMGLIVFPFAAAPMLKRISGLSQEEYLSLMAERKKMIPHWINEITKPIINTNSFKA